jgi:hypothetical protein
VKLKYEGLPLVQGSPSGIFSLAREYSNIANINSGLQGANKARRQFLVARLHKLGPYPLFHFINEIEAGAGIRDTLETYSRLPADFIAAYGGSEFSPLFHVIDGGRR